MAPQKVLFSSLLLSLQIIQIQFTINQITKWYIFWTDHVTNNLSDFIRHTNLSDIITLNRFLSYGPTEIVLFSSSLLLQASLHKEVTFVSYTLELTRQFILQCYDTKEHATVQLRHSKGLHTNLAIPGSPTLNWSLESNA